MRRQTLLANVGAMVALSAVDYGREALGEIVIRPDVDVVGPQLSDAVRLHPKLRKRSKYTPHIGKKQIARNKRRNLGNPS